jgi:hypothetical protein
MLPLQGSGHRQGLPCKESEVSVNSASSTPSSQSNDNTVSSDVDWDIENDGDLCLYGLVPLNEDPPNPADVMRITDLFDSATFFKEGPSSSDIEQGYLGNCWFLSALTAVATIPNLLDRICVERDESVGVYGFVFFRDGYWTDVIIDEYAILSSPSSHTYRWLLVSSLSLIPSIRNSPMKGKGFTIITKNSTTTLLVRDGRVCTLPGLWRKERLGSHLSKRPMQNCMVIMLP